MRRRNWISRGRWTAAYGQLLNAGGAAFSPIQYSPFLWLDCTSGLYKDAAKTQPATTAGDLIYTWADLSGNGRDAIQATEGSRPALAADGSCQFANKKIKAYTTIPRPIEIFFVVNYTYVIYDGFFQSSPGSNVTIFTAETSYRLRMRDNGTDLFDLINDNQTTPGSKMIMHSLFNGESSFLEINGGTKATKAGFTSPASSSNFEIGTADRSFGNMNVYEVLMFGSLTDEQRSTVGQYLAAKWTIAAYGPVALPLSLTSRPVPTVRI